MLPVVLVLALAPAVLAQNLSSSQVDTIRTHLASSAQQSWELGTRAEAILELDTPSWSVLTPSVQFPRSADDFAHPPDSLNEVLEIARSVVAGRSKENKGAVGPQPLVADSAAGDPPSIGFALVLANLTGHTPGSDNVSYETAAKDQLDYILTKVPRTGDGAISHREEQVQLWSDSVYMVPPFLAFYGVATGNETLVGEAVTQCRLYRQYLKDNGSDTEGLWRHVLLGRGTDTGFWSTGNAWAAAGMTRVLATIAASPMASSFMSEQQELIQWANEIQAAISKFVDPDAHLLHNYATDNSTFLDAASTSLMAASIYRLATLVDWGVGSLKHKSGLAKSVRNTVVTAETLRKEIFKTNSSSQSGLEHFTAQMALTPVVNPHQYGEELTLPSTTQSTSGNTTAGQNGGLDESPEGQAFVLELEAAYREWVARGEPGKNGACGRDIASLFVVAATGISVAWNLLA